jgi:hypothetical protein
LSTMVAALDPVTGITTLTDDPGIVLRVRDPAGVETVYSLGPIVHDGTGLYHLELYHDSLGVWYWRWEGDVNARGAAEGTFNVTSAYVGVVDPPDLTDLLVLVPRARRYCEGPYGAPSGLPALSEAQLYAMIADACGDIILYSGTLFRHQLLVTERDPRAGYPTAWSTGVMLTEWEGALIVTQVALNYFFLLFRDMKVSQAIKNEGTEWSYSLSANVIRDYIASLRAARDLALAGLLKHHPVLDRYASNIRVRDQATVAILEWWDTNATDAGGGGIPGGQEAAVIPWTPGWSGGWTP